jgi:hypothetical protein
MASRPDTPAQAAGAAGADSAVDAPAVAAVMPPAATSPDVAPTSSPRLATPPPPQVRSEAQVAVPAPASIAATAAPAPAHTPPSWQDADPSRPTCTVAQLRRFIKSRPWIPMHELRRRFGIDGNDDDVSPMHVGSQTLFIGLPPAEGRLMAELLGAGDVGYELSLDPVTPVVVGVYPMRPVPRG